MKCLLLLAFVSFCHGLALQTSKTDLPTPDLRVLTALDPPALEVEWAPVKHDDPNEPIVGYKVKVWELPPVKTYKYEMIDGVKTLVQEELPPNIGDAITPPEEEAREIVANGPQASRAKVPNIKLNVIYEVRVRAFSARRDGPLSTHMRVQLVDDNKDSDMGNEVNNLLTLGVTDSSLCRAYMEEEETAAHVIMACPGVAQYRAKHLGSPGVLQKVVGNIKGLLGFLEELGWLD